MKPIYWVIVVLTAGAIASGAAYYIKQPAVDAGPVTVAHHEQSSVVVTSSLTSATTSQSADIEGWKTYTDSSHGFEIKFPENWEMVKANPSDEIIVSSGGKKLNSTTPTFTFRLVDTNKIESTLIFTIFYTRYGNPTFYENTVGADSEITKEIVSTFTLIPPENAMN